MFIENKLVLNEEHEKIVSDILGNDFPFFYQSATEGEGAYKQFCHVLVRRRSNEVPQQGIINSNMTEQVITLFNAFCEQNNIQPQNVYRAAVNCTLHNKHSFVDVHVDHKFPHKIFLLYLNEFTQGETLIYDEKGDNIIHTVTPERYKGVIFSGEPHSHKTCGEDERRVVLVVTFN